MPSSFACARILSSYADLEISGTCGWAFSSFTPPARECATRGTQSTHFALFLPCEDIHFVTFPVLRSKTGMRHLCESRVCSYTNAHRKSDKASSDTFFRFNPTCFMSFLCRCEAAFDRDLNVMSNNRARATSGCALTEDARPRMRGFPILYGFFSETTPHLLIIINPLRFFSPEEG